ncbi:MAG: hypothetical protein AVDCRST_MAG48-3797, partial [uncultured Friedmanniella sp.]
DRHGDRPHFVPRPRRGEPRQRRGRLAEEPVRPLHPARSAAGGHDHPRLGVLERHQHHQPAAADVDHRRRGDGRADRRPDRRHRHQRRLGPRAGRRRLGGSLRRPVGAARARRGHRHRRHRRGRERLARGLPRPRAVHRHPGHAGPGPRPRLRLRQRHPDQPAGGAGLRRPGAGDGPRHPGARPHLARRGRPHRLPALPHGLGPARLRHRLQHQRGPQLRHPGEDHPVVGLHPGRPARRPRRLDLPGPVRQRHLDRRQPAGARGHRGRRHRRRPAGRRLRQGVRRRRRHDHLRRHREPAVAAQRVDLPPGRLPRRADPGGRHGGHRAVRPQAPVRLDHPRRQV